MDKSSKSFAIVANGFINDYHTIANLIHEYAHIIAADGGLHHCIKMKVRPGLVVGDLDSVSEELLHEFHDLAIEKYPYEKDETDLELAVQCAFDRGAEQVTIFGGFGNRLDHTLSNVQLMRRFPDKIKMETESEECFIIHKDMTIACHPGQVISFIPLGEPIKSVSSRGLKWELTDHVFKKGFVSQSNECLGSSITIHLKAGELLCSKLTQHHSKKKS